MCYANAEFTEKLLARFAGRTELSREKLYEEYFQLPGLDKESVFECFGEIEFEFGIPVGVLRPEDPLSKLTARITTNNPFKWWSWLGRNEFAGDGLFEDVDRRLKKFGTYHQWKQIMTVGELIHAWCGALPKSC